MTIGIFLAQVLQNHNIKIKLYIKVQITWQLPVICHYLAFTWQRVKLPGNQVITWQVETLTRSLTIRHDAIPIIVGS